MIADNLLPKVLKSIVAQSPTWFGEEHHYYRQARVHRCLEHN